MDVCDYRCFLPFRGGGKGEASEEVAGGLALTQIDEEGGGSRQLLRL